MRLLIGSDRGNMWREIVDVIVSVDKNLEGFY